MSDNRYSASFSCVKEYAIKRKWLSLAVLAGLVVLLMAALSGPGNDEAGATAPEHHRVVRVRTWTVEPVRLLDVLTLPGATEALHDVTVAAERSGRVEWIGPEEGAHVAAEEAFARIDLENARADLSSAQANYELARSQAERRSELHRQEVLSREEMDMANTDLQAARSHLAQARKAFTQGDVVSPVDGVINDLFVDQGEWVNTGQAVAEVVNISTIRVNVNVPEMDVRYLDMGQQVRVTVDAYPEEVWSGEVDFVAFKADETTKTFRVRVRVDNADGRIRPGMLARVSLERRVIDEAVTAPLHALLDKGGERFLFVAHDGTAHARIVKLGVISGDRIQILDGLAPGDELIISGQTQVEEGVAVEVMGKAEAAQ